MKLNYIILLKLEINDFLRDIFTQILFINLFVIHKLLVYNKFFDRKVL